jgi:transposase InsO family protein
MQAMGLAGAVRGRAWTTTTVSAAGPVRPTDLVQRICTAVRPNQLWVPGFTYVATWHGFVYVAFVIDVFARRIGSMRCRSEDTRTLTGPSRGERSRFLCASDFIPDQM